MNVYDPIEQMELERKKAAVDLDELKTAARKWVEETVRKKYGQKGQVRPLVFYPRERLRQPCADSVHFSLHGTKEIRELARDMAFTMGICGGVTLASPQVDLSNLAGSQIRLPVRMFVVDWSADRGHPITVINPDVHWMSDEVTREVEACLSLPGAKVRLKRPAQIRVSFHDERGNRHVGKELEGMAARLFLHGMDHLDGQLMLDHSSVGRLERRQALKKLDRMLKTETRRT